MDSINKIAGTVLNTGNDIISLYTTFLNTDGHHVNLDHIRQVTELAIARLPRGSTILIGSRETDVLYEYGIVVPKASDAKTCYDWLVSCLKPTDDNPMSLTRIVDLIISLERQNDKGSLDKRIDSVMGGLFYYLDWFTPKESAPPYPLSEVNGIVAIFHDGTQLTSQTTWMILQPGKLKNTSVV